MKLLNLGLPRPRPLPIVNCQGTRSTPLSSRTPTVPGLILKLTSFEAYRRSVDYIHMQPSSPFKVVASSRATSGVTKVTRLLVC